MTNPLVTAIVTTYDRPTLVKRAIRSVQQQTHDPLEIIVVEDGTDSGVEEWIDDQGDSAITYVRHEVNQGCSAARNTGFEIAEGEYVAFLDDDDEWKSEFLERAAAFAEGLPEAERERLGVVYAALEMRSPDGEVVSVLQPENEGNLRESIMEVGASTLDSSIFMPAEALADVGGWDESLSSGTVHDMWMELASRGYDARTIEEPLVVMYRDERQRMTTDTDLRLDGVRQYVDKWEPTYEEWFGRSRGRAYADRYFARIISRLAAGKLLDGDLGEASKVIRAIYAESDQTGYNTYALGNALAEDAAKRYLPPRAVRALKRARNRL